LLELETRIYQKKNRIGIANLVARSLKDIHGSRFLSKQLAKRDIKARYRQSFLGILWTIISPLTTGLIWIFLSETGTIKLTDTGIPYPVYAFSGTLIWASLLEAVNGLTRETQGAKSVISKINFPKEALILSSFYKIAFNTLPKIFLLVLMVILFDVGFQLSLLLFPLALLGAIFFGYTLGVFLTPMSLLYTDVNRVVSTALKIAMYITPVVYSVPDSGFMKTVMSFNPLTPMITVGRDLIVGNSPGDLTYYLVILGLSIPLFLIGLVFYRVSIPILVERMNA
jgi:lipopolysaccharide transport system permease protein